jgi:hypothetical protein
MATMEELPFTIEEWDSEGLHRLQIVARASNPAVGWSRNGRHAPAGPHPVQARHPRDGRAPGKRPPRRLGAIQLAGLTISETSAPRGPGLPRGAVPFSTGRGVASSPGAGHHGNGTSSAGKLFMCTGSAT